MKINNYYTAMFSIYFTFIIINAKISSMKITFIGHSRIFGEDDLEERVFALIKKEIENNSPIFYLGDYGNFDDIAKNACQKYKKYNNNSSLIFVTPYISEKYLQSRKERMSKYDETIYPDIEKVPKRYAIVHRNMWMIDNADLVIFYINYSFGGAYNMYQYAKRKKKKFFNLGTLN